MRGGDCALTRDPGGEFREEDLTEVRFVPLIGSEGWDGAPSPGAPRTWHW